MSPKLAPIAGTTRASPPAARHILEAALPVVPYSRIVSACGGRPMIAADDFGDRRHEAGHEQVEPAVVVVVEEPGRKAHERQVDAQRLRDLVECPVLAVVEQEVASGVVRDVQVGEPVVVVVAPGRALGERGARHAGGRADLAERAVALVVVQRARRLLVARRTGPPSRRCRSRPTPRCACGAGACRAGPAAPVTSVNVPSPLLRSRELRIGYSQPPRCT